MKSAAARSFRIETGGPALPGRSTLYAAGQAHCRAVLGEPERDSQYADFAIGVVRRGAFHYTSAQGVATAAPGSILLGNAGEQFAYRWLVGGDIARTVLAVSPDVMREVAECHGQPDPGFLRSALPQTRKTAAIYGALRRLAASSASDDEAVFRLTGAVYSLSGSPLLPVLKRADRDTVVAVARHMDLAFADPIGLDGMAAMAGLSRYHFIRAFRRVTGETPRQYLIGARLRAACDQLLDSRAPVTAIAFEVGFNDISHFNALFRRTYGMAPTAWRNAG